MSKINWGKVASGALMPASALMGFGHDLIEDQKTEGGLQERGREEGARQRGEKDHGGGKNTVSIMEENPNEK